MNSSLTDLISYYSWAKKKKFWYKKSIGNFFTVSLSIIEIFMYLATQLERLFSPPRSQAHPAAKYFSWFIFPTSLANPLAILLLFGISSSQVLISLFFNVFFEEAKMLDKSCSRSSCTCTAPSYNPLYLCGWMRGDHFLLKLRKILDKERVKK